MDKNHYRVTRGIYKYDYEVISKGNFRTEIIHGSKSVRIFELDYE